MRYRSMAVLRRVWRASSLAAGLILLLALPGRASNITYLVSLSVGASGSITGDIITDGTIGTLIDSNFVDWNLVLDTGRASESLLGPLSGSNSGVSTSGAGQSATATQLLFDFSSGWALDFNAGAADFACFGPSNGLCAFGDLGGVIGIAVSADEVNTPLTGVQVIGIEGSLPEPSSLVLLFAGTAALFACRSRRRLQRP